MLHYILQTVVFQLLFLMLYDVFLRNETFFNCNRIYLLFTAVLSLILPFLQINSFNKIIPQDYVFRLPEIIIGQKEIVAGTITKTDLTKVSSGFTFHWEHVIYLGSVITLILFVFKLSKLIILVFKSPKTKFKQAFLIQIINSKTAYSFFNYIFIGDKIYPEEKQTIIAHELEHVKEKHSIDLLFFEILKIIFWFNPLIYLYQNRIANLHEFIADSKAVKSSNKTFYYQNLLSQVFDTKKVSFINPFFKQSLIKKRIIMLSKSKSKQKNVLKYLLLIPVIFGMLLYTSCANEEKTTNDELLDSNSKNAVDEIVEEEILEIEEVASFYEIDEVPKYPGCETLTTNDELRKCFSNNLNKIIAKNFNSSLGKTLGLVGLQKIDVSFTINKLGKIEKVNVKAPHPELKEEAKRLIGLIPDVIPGKQNGKVVNVAFFLPIQFVVKE